MTIEINNPDMMKESSTTVIDKVDALNAMGKHDDAIDVLAGATQNGDEIAKTILGKRLLVGDRSPYLPREGASFIMEAAQAGIPEAVSVIAVFQATGIFQEKNWPQAINTLTHAAILGSELAREQLILLSNSGDPTLKPALINNNEAEYWQSLASAINLEDWINEPAGQLINDEPQVKVFPGLLSAPICRWLIKLSASRLKPALVYDASKRQNYKSETRTNSIAEFNLVENELLHFLIQQKMSAACGIPMVQMEGTAILNYQPGEEISDHFDFVNPSMPDYDQEIKDNGQRIITFLIYLNDDYEGGETVFTELDLSYKGNTGDGMFFVNALPDGSSDLRSKHAGRPTSSGEKWIISQFIRNREVKYIQV